MINVTKTYLPPKEEYISYLTRIWESSWVTNRGSLVRELEERLQAYLDVKHLLYVANGTLALQIAIKALKLQGEIITTPFSYVATTTAILWEHCYPAFVDIDPQTYCIDPEKIEPAINGRTSAILAVHPYGYPCDIEKIQRIAEKYDLKVIYDAAQAFGIRINGTSVLNFGDVAILSFHATKLFHTIEGGAIITHDADLAHELDLYHRFGHTGDAYYTLGINAKSSEFHAAMGLCLLPMIDGIIKRRNELIVCYNRQLPEAIRPLSLPENVTYNGAYYPVIFASEERMLIVKNLLAHEQIYVRRYFYPTLNQLPYLTTYHSCPIAEDIARRVLCLPLYYELTEQSVREITELILKGLE